MIWRQNTDPTATYSIQGSLTLWLAEAEEENNPDCSACTGTMNTSFLPKKYMGIIFDHRSKRTSFRNATDFVAGTFVIDIRDASPAQLNINRSTVCLRHRCLRLFR